MRYIYFRAWDKKSKKMVSVWKIGWKTWDRLQVDEVPINFVEVEDDGTYELMEHEVELMQFTGEIARDKKEVYQGDIIEYRFEDGGAYSPPYKGEVKFSQGRFECPYGIGEVEIMRVLGNIYENPELIKSDDLSLGA